MNIKIETNKLLQEFKKEYNPKSIQNRVRTGDLVVVEMDFSDGNKRQTKKFQGLVIGENKKSFVVLRKGKYDSLEIRFSYRSPAVQKVTVLRSYHIRQSNAYYMRTTKSRHLKEKTSSK